MAKETGSGEIVEELREIRKVMVELVGVMKKVASGLERRKKDKRMRKARLEWKGKV